MGIGIKKIFGKSISTDFTENTRHRYIESRDFVYLVSGKRWRTSSEVQSICQVKDYALSKDIYKLSSLLSWCM